MFNLKCVEMLIVEGTTDQHFVLNLLEAIEMEKAGIPWPSKEGSKNEAIDKFLSELQTDRSQPIGLIVDADGDIEATISSLIKKLKKWVDVSPDQFKNGLVFSPPFEPKAGIWIWPDCERSGILEDLFLDLVKPSDQLLEEAKKVVDRLPAIEPFRFPPQYKSKAIVHTWLAWQKKPGLPIGMSVKTSSMNLTHPTVSNFKSWLQRLYQHD